MTAHAQLKGSGCSPGGDSTGPTSARRAEDAFAAKIRQYDDDCEFVRRTNIGSERMKPEDQARVSHIARYMLRSARESSSSIVAPRMLCASRCIAE